MNAIAKAGTTDAAKVVEALRSNPVDTPLGKLTFSKTGDAAGMGLSIYQIKDGKFVELNHSITLD